MIVSIKKRIIFLFFRLIHLKTGLFIRMNFLIIQNKCNFILFVFTFYTLGKVEASFYKPSVYLF